MKYTRNLLSDYTMVTPEEDIPGNFTSVRGEYMDPKTQKTGFYKMNGSFWGEPDLRELLASIILKQIGVPCADIQLVYDDIGEQENGCLSMSILKQGEKFVQEDDDWLDLDLQDFDKGIDKILETDVYSYKKVLPNLSQEFWEQRKDFLIRYSFISAFLGNDDIKTDNCLIICNSINGTYRNPEYYDMGMSFSGLSKNRTFYDGKTDIDVLTELYQKYPEQIKQLSYTIGNNLTQEYIKGLLEDETFYTLSAEERKRIWTELGKKIAFISRANEQYYGQKGKQNGFNIEHEDLMNLLKKTPINIKEKTTSFFTKMFEKIAKGVGKGESEKE